MGLLDKLGSVFSSKKREFNLLVVGLDNAGKTAIVSCLKPGGVASGGRGGNTSVAAAAQAASLAPTLGFNTEKILAKTLTFTTYDMSGQSKYRSLWEHYYKDADALIFVVDSSDKMRVVVAMEELFAMLDHPHLKARSSVPLLVLANKMDIKNSLSDKELKRELQLDSIRGRPWAIYSCDGLTGEGILPAFEWLTQKIAVAP